VSRKKKRRNRKLLREIASEGNIHTGTAGRSKCGARLEALLQGPISAVLTKLTGHQVVKIEIGLSSVDARRLKLRCPFVPAAQQLNSFSDNNSMCVAHWAYLQWNVEQVNNPTRLCIFIPDTGAGPPGMTLPRRAWVWLICLRTGVGRCCSLNKWGMVSSATYECGAKEQTFTMLSSIVQSLNLLTDCLA